MLGVLAAIAGSPRIQRNARVDVASLATIVKQEEDHVTAIELADWIRSRRENLRIIDVRSAEDFDAYHIPGAERIPLDSLVAKPFRTSETIVLYSDGGAHAAQGWVFLRALGLERVYFLRGGLYEWLNDVMNPTISVTASDSARESFARTAELSRYFGGVPREGERQSLQPSIPVPARSTENDGRPNAVARVRGRGC
jgi:rhodanese-related sulfurtransferase